MSQVSESIATRQFCTERRYIREGRRADKLLTFYCKILRLLSKMLLFTLEDIMLALKKKKK
jgi:hypothetical protein